MEVPGIGANMSVVYPTLDAVPPHLRRPLAPLTPSPRASLVFQGDSEFAKMSSQQPHSSSSSKEIPYCGQRQGNGMHIGKSAANVVLFEREVLRPQSSVSDYLPYHVHPSVS